MNRISLTDLAKNKPLEPLLEKEMQVRAYELYEQRGKGDGFALQDWLPQSADRTGSAGHHLVEHRQETRRRHARRSKAVPLRDFFNTHRP